MNYFEFYPGDYLKATGRLTLTEHGAYLRLLMEYYATEEPLPADYDELYVIASAIKPADRAAVKKVADRFFPVGQDGLRHNDRADEEVVKAQKRMSISRQNGAKGGRPRKPAGNPDGNPAGNPPGIPAGTLQETCSGEALHTPHAIQKLSPDSPTLPTRDARTPADEPDLVGQFEGHENPKPAAPNPATPLAIALNGAGFRCTAMNPDLVAYAQAGGTAEHLTAVAAHPDCAGKSATYVVRFARRELTDQAKPITPTARAGPNGTPPPTSKSVQALQALEALKSHDSLAPDRNRDRPAEAAPALARPHAVR